MMQSRFRKHLLSTAMAAALLAAPVPGLAENALRQVNLGAGAAEVTANPGEVVEVLLADGTSVVLAPGSAAQVSSDGAGVDIVLTAGLMRVSGGAGNATNDIRIQTPQGTARLTAGVAIVAVENGATRAHLLAGEEIALNCGKRTRDLYRPGFQSVCKGGAPSVPRKMTAAEIAADLARLTAVLKQGAAGGGRGGAAPAGGAQQAAPAGGGGGGGEDEAIAAPPPPAEDPPAVEPPFGAIDLAGSFGIENVAAGDDATQTQSSTNDGRSTAPAQELNYGAEFGPRNLGPTTNSVGFSEGFALAGDQVQGLTAIDFGGRGLTESDARGLSYVIERANRAFGMKRAEVTNGLTGGVPALFLFSPALTVVSDGAPDSIKVMSGVFTSDTILSRTPSPNQFTSDSAFGPFREFRDPDFTTIEEVRRALLEVSEFVFTPDPGSSEGFRIIDHLSLDDAAKDALAASESTLYARTGVGASMEGLALGGLDEGANRGPDNFVFMRIDGFPAFQVTTQFGDPVSREAVDFFWNEYLAARYPEASEAFNSLDHRTFDPDSPVRSVAGLILDAPTGQNVTFAAGDLDGLAEDASPGRSIDRYTLSAGLPTGTLDEAGEPFVYRDGEGNPIDWFGTDPDPLTDLDAGMRGFLRAESWTDLDGVGDGGGWLQTRQLTDSGLIVVNPAGELTGEGVTSKLLHADFGIAETRGRQVSTISVTVGGIEFRLLRDRYQPAGAPPAMGDALATAQTIGTARGFYADGGVPGFGASTLFTSAFRSTAAGGGNPLIDEDGVDGDGDGILDGDGTPDVGRLGFIVFENAGTIFDDVAGDPVTLEPGLEQPLGGDETEFALLRLGIATEVDRSFDLTRFTGRDIGFAAGIMEVEGSSSVGLAGFGQGGSAWFDFAAPGDDDTAFAADLVFNGERIAFGGPGGASAFASHGEFGAVATGDGAKMAMVSGEMVKDELTVSSSDKIRPIAGGYDHVKWGFFFGDLPAANGARRHMHLGSFASGTPTRNFDQARAGNVTYRGHVVGNVAHAGQVYTATGGFTETFSFAANDWSGSPVISDFDGRTFRGSSEATRSGVYSGTAASGPLGATLDGRFVGDLVSVTGGTAPKGLVGSFSISGELGSGGYRALGTFGAETD